MLARMYIRMYIPAHTKRVTFCFHLYPSEYLKSESKKNKFVIAFDKLT